MPGNSRCWVRDCEARSTDVDMVRIPKDLKIRRQWAKLVGVQYYDFPVYAKICVTHFTEDDFIRAVKKTPFGTAHIKPGALPSQNLPRETMADEDYQEVLRCARGVIGDSGFGQDSEDEACELKNNKDDKEYLKSVLMILKDAETKIEKVKQLREKYRRRAEEDEEEEEQSKAKRIVTTTLKMKQQQKEPDMKSYVENVVKPRHVAIKEGLIGIVDTSSDEEADAVVVGSDTPAAAASNKKKKKKKAEDDDEDYVASDNDILSDDDMILPDPDSSSPKKTLNPKRKASGPPVAATSKKKKL